MKEIKDPSPTRIIRILIQGEELVKRTCETGEWFCCDEQIMYFVASVFLVCCMFIISQVRCEEPQPDIGTVQMIVIA